MVFWNKKESPKASDVFGQSRELPLNYIEREGIDDLFVEALDFKKHLVLYGSSKQGKTSLRKHNLDADQYISIHCSNKWGIDVVNAQILKQAGYELTVSTTKTYEGKSKIKASFNLFSIFEAGAEGEVGESDTVEIEPLELDLSDVNDVITALTAIKFDKYIILEDFHYLKEDTQQDFAIQLKAFHENSDFTFICVGVWLEENRLILLNGDLAGRVFSINADEWTSAKLYEVLNKGTELLNIEFEQSLQDSIVSNCNGSVFILQEVCLKICVLREVGSRQKSKVQIKSEGLDVPAITREIVMQQSGRYNSFLTGFALGFQETTLEMYKWLLYPIIRADFQKLDGGFSYRELKESITSKHPKGDRLNLGNLTMALGSIASLQIRKNIKPNILDYDQSNLKLNVVDRGFIIWLGFQDRGEVLSKVGLPED